MLQWVIAATLWVTIFSPVSAANARLSLDTSDNQFDSLDFFPTPADGILLMPGEFPLQHSFPRRGVSPSEMPSLTENLLRENSPLNFQPIMADANSLDPRMEKAESLLQQGTPESLKAALQILQEAREFYQKTGDISQLALSLHKIGFVYSQLGELPAALAAYQQALPLRHQAGDLAGEASTLNNLGFVYSQLGEYQKALDTYQQALPLRQQGGDLTGKANTLNNIGFVYESLQQFNQAIDAYHQALLLWRQQGNPTGEIQTLNNLGFAYLSGGNFAQSLQIFQQALSQLQQFGNTPEQAATLTYLSKVYEALGDIPHAIQSYQQALSLLETIGDSVGQAHTLTQMGQVNATWGNSQAAITAYQQALVLWRQQGDTPAEASTLTYMGQVYETLGEYQQALDVYNQSLSQWRQLGNSRGEAATLNNLGLVYDALGNFNEAFQYYTSALLLWKKIGNKAGEAKTLNNIGLYYDAVGEPNAALDAYQKALSLWQTLGDFQGQAATLNNIGYVYANQGQKEPQKLTLALDSYHQALPLWQKIGDRKGEASTLTNLGFIYATQGNLNQALDYYNRGLLLRQAVGDRDKEALTRYRIAIALRDQGKLDEAQTQIEDALTLIETLRTKVTSQELRTSFFAAKQDYYEFYIDLLMRQHQQHPDQGYEGQALAASERARARSLLDILTEAGEDIQAGIDPQLLAQEKALQTQLSTLEERRIQLLSSPHTDAQADVINGSIANLLGQYQGIQAKIRATSPRYAALTQPVPLTLAQIQQQVLDDQSILLEYFLGKSRSYLWLVSRNSIKSYELPKRQEIEQAARNFRGALLIPRYRFQPAKVQAATQALSQIILAPVAAELANKRLLIVSDGALQYIPFPALTLPVMGTPGGQGPWEPLIVQHEIISLPSASTLGILRQELTRRTPNQKTIAVLADPVFGVNDERLSQTLSITPPPLPPDLERSAREAGVYFNRLPFTQQEAEQILALVPPSDSTQALGLAANRQFATRSDLGEYRIVHFATHGLLNSITPELSGLVLSLVNEAGQPQNGFLRLPDIFNLHLPVELVVLSACETGLGQQVRGEGVVGLTRGFMYAGAARVVVSLWSVDDQATAALMVNFYQQMLQNGLTPAAALRAAQIKMWQQPQWQAPYYWAAFTLQGEWR